MTAPRFAERSELLRYIDEDKRLRGNRPHVAAFLPDPPSATPDKDYLSVNALELEAIDEIAGYHRMRMQNGEGKVALCAHKVSFYNDAARKCGIALSFDRESKTWVFIDRGKPLPAYAHHPRARTDQLKSPSHCGVEFTRGLRTEHEQAKFARRMTKVRFHLK